MRYIEYNENCFTANEIVLKLYEADGIDLHLINVSNVAKRLDLDYIEVPLEDPKIPWVTTQRAYGEKDLPAILQALRELAASRGPIGASDVANPVSVSEEVPASARVRFTLSTILEKLELYECDLPAAVRAQYLSMLNQRVLSNNQRWWLEKVYVVSELVEFVSGDAAVLRRKADEVLLAMIAGCLAKPELWSLKETQLLRLAQKKISSSGAFWLFTEEALALSAIFSKYSSPVQVVAP